MKIAYEMLKECADERERLTQIVFEQIYASAKKVIDQGMKQFLEEKCISIPDIVAQEFKEFYEKLSEENHIPNNLAVIIERDVNDKLAEVLIENGWIITNIEKGGTLIPLNKEQKENYEICPWMYWNAFYR